MQCLRAAFAAELLDRPLVRVARHRLRNRRPRRRAGTAGYSRSSALISAPAMLARARERARTAGVEIELVGRRGCALDAHRGRVRRDADAVRAARLPAEQRGRTGHAPEYRRAHTGPAGSSSSTSGTGRQYWQYVRRNGSSLSGGTTVTKSCALRRRKLDAQYRTRPLPRPVRRSERPDRRDVEDHRVRFFFPLELQLFLDDAGFDLIRIGDFEDFERDPDESTWNVLVAARRRG